MSATPTLAELRRVAEAEGVTPSDDDLEAVRAFLDVLLPQFAELESLVGPEAEP